MGKQKEDSTRIKVVLGFKTLIGLYSKPTINLIVQISLTGF